MALNIMTLKNTRKDSTCCDRLTRIIYYNYTSEGQDYGGFYITVIVNPVINASK